MNDLRGPLTRDALPRHPDDLDGLLRTFFRSEMPDPWPAAPRVRPALRPEARPAPRRPWFRQPGRLALAAAVSCFLIGYLALSSAFPSSGPGAVVAPGGRPFAIDKVKPRPPAPAGVQKGDAFRPILIPREVVPVRGGKAQISGHQTNGPRPTTLIHVERLP